ncbi:MAG TPA: ribonuclease P protein component [Bacillota bacterium]|nr:ribonuclease P protein component [Bacillota bacterium]
MWERLHRPSDFRAVFDGGTSVANALAALYVLPSGRSRSRIAVAAGKRLGGAVLRNRHRRRWREVLRLRVAPPDRPIDAVLVSRARAGTADFAALERSLRDLLERSARTVPGSRGGSRAT